MEKRRFVQPVKVGDIIDATIEAVGEKGDGLFKKDGFVIFVPQVREGQEVKVKVTKVLKKVGFGEVFTGSEVEDVDPERDESEDLEDVQGDDESEDSVSEDSEDILDEKKL